MASQKSEQITSEMIDFSVAVIKMTEEINVPLSIKTQLIRSATSIGANFSEAQESASKKDFVNKIAIAKKEANETKYWLKIITSLGYPNKELEVSTQKFLMILQKIISTAKAANRT